MSAPAQPYSGLVPIDPREGHSIRHDLHAPTRGQTREETAGALVGQALADYGAELARVVRLGDELEKRFTRLARLEKDMQQQSCSPPRPHFSACLKAAWQQFRGPQEAPVG